MLFRIETFSRETFKDFDLFVVRNSKHILKEAYNKKIHTGMTGFVDWMILASVSDEENPWKPKNVGVVFVYTGRDSNVVETCMEAVVTAYRHKGAGTLMMNAAKAIAKKEGAHKLACFTDIPLDPIHEKFLLKLGYSEDDSVDARAVEKAWSLALPKDDVTASGMAPPA